MESNPIKKLPHLCYSCQHKGETVKATEWCKSCNIKCCESCMQNHSSVTEVEHKVETVQSRTDAGVPTLRTLEKEIAQLNLVPRTLYHAPFQNDSLKAYYVTDFSARLSDDVMDCYITSCLVLENKQFLIVDKNNMKLKLFDSKGGHIVSAETPNVTWGITQLSNHSFATCGSGNKVIFWDVKEDKISNMSEIKVYGIAYGISNNSSLICTMHPDFDSLTVIKRNPEKVINYKRFYDPNGKFLRFGFDLELDECFAYVGCGLGDKRIVAISLIFMSITWECQLPGNTCGILNLGYQLLVADMTNKKIVTVSKKGEMLDTVISLEFMEGRPQYIGGNSTGRSLLVSQYGADVITVFGIRRT